MAAIYKRKNSKGETRYRALIRRKGHRQLSATFTSKAKAAAWAKTMEDEVTGGRFIRRSMIDHLTYKDAFEKRLLEANLDPKDSTVRRAEWWADLRRLGSIRLADITRSDIERCIHELRSTPKFLGGFNIHESNQRRSEATITRYITLLSAVLQHYVDPKEGQPHNPARCIKRKKPTEQPVMTINMVPGVFSGPKTRRSILARGTPEHLGTFRAHQ